MEDNKVEVRNYQYYRSSFRDMFNQIRKIGKIKGHIKSDYRSQLCGFSDTLESYIEVLEKENEAYRILNSSEEGKILLQLTESIIEMDRLEYIKHLEGQLKEYRNVIKSYAFLKGSESYQCKRFYQELENIDLKE